MACFFCRKSDNMRDMVYSEIVDIDIHVTCLQNALQNVDPNLEEVVAKMSEELGII